MIEEVGVVQQVSDNQIVVQTELQNSCHACAQKSHCGTGVIARAIADRISDVVVDYEPSNELLVVGQQVRLGVKEESLLAASSIMYLVPLFALISGALIGQQLLPILGFSGESWLIIFTVVWVWLAYRGIRIWTKKHCHQKFSPILMGSVTVSEKPDTSEMADKSG